MTAIQAQLQALPAPLRQTLYSLVTILGLTLGVLQAIDVNDLGPLTMTQALQVYAYLSPLVGAVAVANVKKPVGDSAALGELVEEYDLDMSAFEPVGDMDDVYGAAAQV